MEPVLPPDKPLNDDDDPEKPDPDEANAGVPDELDTGFDARYEARGESYNGPAGKGTSYDREGE
jgi:hypothetical protein